MPDDFVIRPFLMKNKAEVELMCITEYNEAETMELLREESEAKGIAIGKFKILVSLAKKGLLTEEIAAREASMSLNEFRKCEAFYAV